MCAPQAATHQYADCFLNPADVPEELLRGAVALVTGTLGLACQPTDATMQRAVDIAKSNGVTVRPSARAGLGCA